MTLSNIAFSTVDVDFVKKYLRIDDEFKDDDVEIELFLDVAKSWVMDHTEMTIEELDNIKYATILLLKFTADFYNDRNAKYSNKFTIDPVMDILLSKIRSYNLGSIEEDKQDTEGDDNGSF